MSLGGILILVLLVISLFVFIYLMVITAKFWGILHTVLLSFLFIEAWTFLFLTAGVADRRLAILKDYTNTRDQVAKLKNEVTRLTWGGDNIAEEQEALVPLAGQVRRLTSDRGRVWRNVARGNVEGDQVRLELLAPPPAADAAPLDDPNAAAAAAPAAAPVNTGTIAKDMVVHAFSQVDNEQKHPIPQTYLGAYQIVESQGGQLLAKPLLPLEPRQIKARDDETTWSLYELLPQDNHETYLADGAQPSDEAHFGVANAELLQTMFAEIPEEGGRRQKVIDSYLRDGSQATESDPPRHVWQLVEAVKAVTLDVDSGEQANVIDGLYFNTSGASVDVRLKNETKEVTVPEGRQFLLPPGKQTNDMIAAGDVKLIRPIYVRPLNAYEKSLSFLKLRRDEAIRQIAVVDREKSVLDEANNLAQSTRQQYVETQARFVADTEKYKQELLIINNEIQAINNKVQQTSTQLVQLYNSVHAAWARKNQ